MQTIAQVHSYRPQVDKISLWELLGRQVSSGDTLMRKLSILEDRKTPNTPCLLLVFPYVLFILTVKYQTQSWITLGLTQCGCSLLTLIINK